MKTYLRFVLLLSTLALIINCQKKEDQEVVQNILKEAPQHSKLVFENEFARVVEFYLKPGEKLPMHQGGKRLVYALTDFSIQWKEGGEVSSKDWTRRDIHWHDGIPHAVENIGDTDAYFVVFTRQEQPLPSTGEYTVSMDAVVCDTTHTSMVFKNDYVCVAEVNIPPGEKQPMHQGINRLIYSLDPYKIRYTSDKMGIKESSMEAGEVHWHTADAHAVENIGDTPVSYLIIAFLK